MSQVGPKTRGEFSGENDEIWKKYRGTARYSVPGIQSITLKQVSIEIEVSL